MYIQGFICARNTLGACSVLCCLIQRSPEHLQEQNGAQLQTQGFIAQPAWNSKLSGQPGFLNLEYGEQKT